MRLSMLTFLFSPGSTPLVKLLATVALDPAEQTAVTTVLRAKCDVLAAGAARRGRADEAARYRQLARAGECHAT